MDKHESGPRKTCPNGHVLMLQKAQEGNCDVCDGDVDEGEEILICTECDEESGWYLCLKCAAPDRFHSKQEIIEDTEPQKEGDAGAATQKAAPQQKDEHFEEQGWEEGEVPEEGECGE